MRTGAVLSLVLAAVLTAGFSLAFGQTQFRKNEPAKAAELRGSNVWIDRPWDMRYIISITQRWPTTRKVAAKLNATSKPEESLMWQPVFEPITTIPIPPTLGAYENFTVVVIEFDKQGMVTTNHGHGGSLRGRLDGGMRVLLSGGDAPSDRNYRLGELFMGLGDISTHWAPGLCTVSEQPSPFSKTDTLYLYGPKFEISEFRPTFGCREWAYQLYDDERPYIDVTSYVRVGKVYPKHTYINDVIGFARFGDKKPVIGQHVGQWYCLHDCPGADLPGPIADIKAWAALQGWKIPRPPTKAPTFPDPPATAGAYPR